MGLLIEATENRPINILGSDFSIKSAYARINFKAHPNGKTLEIGLDIYLSKEKYMEGVTIFTDIPNGNFFVQLDPLVETQSLDYAHTYAIQYFDNLGYHCTFL